MNSCGQSLFVGVSGEGHDSRVPRKPFVELMKMSSIVREDRAAEKCGVSHHVRIRDTLICAARVESSEYIMAKATQQLN